MALFNHFPVGLAHAPLTDEGGDVVMAESVTYGEGHRVSWLRRSLGMTRQSQLVDATNRLNTSDAFIQPNVCRGRLLSWRATAFNSARV